MGSKQKFRMSEVELETLAREEQKEQVADKDDDFYERYGIKKSKNYIDKNEFYEEMKTYQDLCEKTYEEVFLPEFNAAVAEAKSQGEKEPSLKDKYWKNRWLDIKPIIPNCIGKKFMLIAAHLTTLPNFNNYSYKEVFISDALESMVKYCSNFDCNKSKNPFAYFTQVAWYCFIRRIQLEKKQSAIKGKLMMNSINDEFADYEGDDSGVSNANEAVRNSHTFVKIAYDMQLKEQQELEERQRIKAEKKIQKQNETNLSSLFESDESECEIESLVEESTSEDSTTR